MYIRSSIIAVLLVTTFISTNSVQAFGPQDFSPFGSGGSGGGSGSGMAGALSTQKIADDAGNLVTDLLKVGNNGASSGQMDKRYDESGDGVAMSSGQQQDSLPQKAVDLMNDLSSGGSMVIKRGEEGKKSHGNKKDKNNKRRRHNNKKNNGEPSFATMPTSLRRRSGLIPLPGGGGSGGGLGGLTGGLSGKGAAPSADPPSGGFKMALIGARKRGLGNNGRQGNSGIVKDLTSAVGITDDPIGKSDSPINAGGLKLSLRDLNGVDGLLDDVTGALGGSDNGYPPSSHRYHDLHAADYSDGNIEGPQLGVLDHLQGGASGAGPLGGGGASKLGMDGQKVSGPKIDILKRRSLNQLSASDRMARAKQGVVVDNDNEQQHEAMKRDSSGNGGNNGMMGNNGGNGSNGGNGGNNGMMGNNGNGGQNPPSFSPSSSSSNDPQYNEHSFMTSDSDKKEKKKGGGGFSMALVDLPIRRRQLDSLGGDGLSKLTGDEGLVGSLLGGLGGGKVDNGKESITKIEQKSTSPSHQFTDINSNDQFQDAAIDTPQYDTDTQQTDADMERYDTDMSPPEVNMEQPDIDMSSPDQNNFFDDSQVDPNDAPYDYDAMGQQ